MAVRIRLTRTGRLNRPFYRIGVYDSRTRRDGRIIEQLGYYDPMLSTGTEWKLDVDRLQYWIGKGAKPSEIITAYLQGEKVRFYDRKKIEKRNDTHSVQRKAARRRTGRTVEATAKPLMPKKPGGSAKPPAKKKAAKPAAPKKEEPKA